MSNIFKLNDQITLYFTDSIIIEFLLNAEEFQNGNNGIIKSYKIDNYDTIGKLSDIIVGDSKLLQQFNNIQIFRDQGVVIISLHNVENEIGYKYKINIFEDDFNRLYYLFSNYKL